MWILSLVPEPERTALQSAKPLHTEAREALHVVRAKTDTHKRLRSRIVFVFVATLLVDLAASVLIFVFERHANGTKITNVGDAIFWTSTQLLTVSSQLPNPISTPARVLDVFLHSRSDTRGRGLRLHGDGPGGRATGSRGCGYKPAKGVH